MRVVFNFGLKPFNQTLLPILNAINEPDCIINSYVKSSAILLEQFRSYILAFNMPEFRGLSPDERMLVGSIILEYLQPLIEDDYIFESLLMEMLRQMIILKKTEAVHFALQTFEVHYQPEQYRDLVSKIATSAIGHLLHQPMSKSDNQT